MLARAGPGLSERSLAHLPRNRRNSGGRTGMATHPFIGRTVGNYVLRRLIDQGGVGMVFIAEHRYLGASVAIGLQAAHEKGIIHRDLKPGNIFLCKNGVTKLLDFGMAKMSQGLQTAVGIVVGTPQYMAPEQVQQGRKVGPTTDIYGLG